MTRLFLCDPVCILPYGHNVAALRNLRTYLSEDFEEVFCLGTKYLDAEIASDNDIERFFGYYYNDVMPVITDYRSKGEDVGVTHDAKLNQAKKDLARFLQVYAITGSDTLCYPSIDFYALSALATSVDALKAAGSPTIMLRFIGVMEYAAAGAYYYPEKVALAYVRLLIDNGFEVRIAAETPKYAEKLAVELDTAVTVAANIETRALLPLPDRDYFHVICPGSARHDKGFFSLEQIFTGVRTRDPGLNIRFTTQILPDNDIKHQQVYHTKLYAIPGVTLLPAQIPAHAIDKLYADADLVLLPYARDIYEYRGSAVFIEAVCSGRPTITLEGCAFVDQIRFFTAGSICSDPNAMIETIIRYSKSSRDEMMARARQSRKRFLADLAASYHDWVSR